MTPLKTGPRALRACFLFVAWTVCASSTAAAAGFDRNAAEEILRLLGDRELPGTKFQVPLGAYREFVRLKKFGPPEDVPPVPYIISAQTHRLALGDKAADVEVSLLLRVFDADGAGWIPLLPQSVAFRDSKVNGKVVKLKPIDRRASRPAPNAKASRPAARWLAWKPSKPGTYTITSSARLKPQTISRLSAVSYECRRSVRNVAVVSSARAWEVFSPDRAAGKIVGDADGTRGKLVLSPRDLFTIYWREPLERAEHAPVVSTTCYGACDFGPGAVTVNAAFDVFITRGPADSLVLDLPAGADRVTVRGPDVRRVTGRGSSRTVHLRGAVRGRTRLSVGFEIPRRGGKGKVALDYFGIRGAAQTAGQLIVSNSAGGELLEEEAERLEPEAFFGLPERLLALSPEKPLLAYSMKRGKWRLVCDAVLASELPMPPTIVDTADHVIVIRADGNLMAKSTFQVRNNDRQFFRLGLPKGTKLTLALVDEKAVPVTPGKNGAFILPLQKSIATVGGLVSFPVEIVYIGRTAGLGTRGDFELPIPRVDAPVAFTTCKLYVPKNFEFANWRGALEHVDLLTTEGEHEEMVYGRGHTRGIPERPPRREPEDRLVVTHEPDSGKDGRERKPVDGPAAKPQPAPDFDGDGNMADNWYRAAVEAYNRKDYANARAQLQQTIKAAPKSVAAVNARKLLGNVDLALNAPAGRGQAGAATGRFVRARAGQITKALQAGDEKLLAEQQQLLKRGEELARKGDSAAATQTLAGVILLGDQLGDRGQRGKEQQAIVERARKGFAVQLEKQKKVLAVEQKLAQLTVEVRRNLDEQARLVQRTRGGEAGAAGQGQGQGGGRGGVLRDAIRVERDAVQAQDDFGLKDANGDKVRRALKQKEVIVEALEELAQDRPARGPQTKPPEKRPGPSQELAARRVLLQRARAQVKRDPAFLVLPRQQDADELETKAQELAELNRKLTKSVRAQREYASRVADQRYETALNQTSRRRYADAEKHLLSALEADPKHGKAREKLATIRGLLRKGPTGEPSIVDGDRTKGQVQLGFATGGLRKAITDAKRLMDETKYEAALEKLDAARGSVKVLSDGSEVRRELNEIKSLSAAAEAGRQRVAAEEHRRRLDAARQLAEPESTWRTTRSTAIPFTRTAPLYPDDWDEKRRRVAGLETRRRPPGGAKPQKSRSVTRFYDVTDLTIDVSGLTIQPRGGGADAQKQIQRDLNRFIAENVKWQPDTAAPQTALDDGENRAVYRNGKLIVTHTPEVQGQIRELLANTRKNWGQKVNIRSYNHSNGMNVVFFDSHVKFTEGKNHARYAVVDEGQVRAMVELGQKQSRTAVFEENPIANDVAVGNRTTIANNDQLTIVASNDRGNRIDYLDNGVFVPHGKYLVVDNNGYFTVVGATQTYRWDERIPAQRIVIDVPPQIDLPLVGRVVKFEKTLLQPEDEPVLRASYRAVEN